MEDLLRSLVPGPPDVASQAVQTLSQLRQFFFRECFFSHTVQ
jgi:hypothetical protein